MDKYLIMAVDYATKCAPSTMMYKGPEINKADLDIILKTHSIKLVQTYNDKSCLYFIKKLPEG